MASNIPSESLVYDNLLAGSVQPAVVNTFTLASGAGACKRGCVLGRITASGKLKPVDKSKADGTEKVYCVLAKDADATSADVVNVPVYLTGEFRESGLTFGATDTAADHSYNASLVNIYFRKSVL